MPLPATSSAKERVLVVDDDPQMRELIARILRHAGYRCAEACDAAEAHQALHRGPFDLLVCDVQLPDRSGLETVEDALSTLPRLAALMISGLDDVTVADRALQVGAYGFIVKPFTANDVLRGVLGALRHRERDFDHEEELRASREETVQRLCIAVEARDPDTALHIDRMSCHCETLARHLGLRPELCSQIRAASPMHDVGKIAVPDSILLKADALTPDERVVMERHAEVGYRILAGSRAPLLRMAAEIAWTHHERFDGTGYPRGLEGDDIPIAGRIAAVADVWDALNSDRVYRPRFRRADGTRLMLDARATHFDPHILDVFLATLASQ